MTAATAATRAARCPGCLWALSRRPEASTSAAAASRAVQRYRANAPYSTSPTPPSDAPQQQRRDEDHDRRESSSSHKPAESVHSPKTSTSSGVPPPSSPTLSSLQAQLAARSSRNLALTKQRLDLIRQNTRTKLSKSQTELSKRFQDAAARINDATGYAEIEKLKTEIAKTEIELNEARQAARDAKEAHAMALTERMNSGREVADLLQRKATWLDSDVLRFTQLVKSDHSNEQNERDKKVDVQRQEEKVEKSIDGLMRSILRRYHEEQIWSDKIRSLSTYGTLAITCINVLVFLLALILIEPWKRKRLVREVESRIKERDDTTQAKITEDLAGLRNLLTMTLATVGASPDAAAHIADVSAQKSVGSQHSKAAAELAAEEQVQDDVIGSFQGEADALFDPADDAALIGSDETLEPAKLVSSKAGKISIPLEVEAGMLSPAEDELVLFVRQEEKEEKHQRDLIFSAVGGALAGGAIVSIVQFFLS